MIGLIVNRNFMSQSFQKRVAALGELEIVGFDITPMVLLPMSRYPILTSWAWSRRLSCRASPCLKANA